MKAILESGIPGVFFWLYDDDDGYDIFFFCSYVFPLLYWAMCLFSVERDH